MPLPLPTETAVGGIVLCGGWSRRMGKPKVWLPCEGEYLLQRMVRIIGGVLSPVVAACHRDQSLPPLPPNVELAFDEYEDSGPLAGISSGLDAIARYCDAAFVCACDHPLLKPGFIRRMGELLGDAPGAVPMYEDRLHPLTAIYRTSTRPLLSQMLQDGELRARDFASRCGARIVTPVDLGDVDPELESLRNVNDAETFAKVIQADGSHLA